MDALRLCRLVLPLLLAGCGAGEHSQPGNTSTGARLSASGGPAPQHAAAPGPAISFSGYLSQYTVAAATGGYLVTDNLSGAAQLVPADSRLRFADTALALDLSGNAGQAYRLYQAAFKRKPDLAGLGYHIGTMDNGAPLNTVAASFVTSQEFMNLYGAPDSAAFVTLLYANVLGRAPDAAGLAYHVGNLDGTGPLGVRLSQAEVLAQFSDSPENIALLANAVRSGIEYLPFGSSLPANAIAEYAGQYEVAVRGADQGAIGITIQPDGTMALFGHLVNQDASGSATLQPGGRFSAALPTTAGQSVTLTGSLNLAAGVLAGSWVNTSTGQAGVFSWTKPVQPVQKFPQVQAIIMQRCVPCHSVRPTIPGFSPAPLGIRFDTEAEIRARSTQIFSSTVQSQFMPWANMTGMTQAERDLLAAWFAAGMPP
jgi:mono/diheme cytochrome c family protein